MTLKITIPLDRATRIARGIADGRTSTTVELTEAHLAELTEAERAVLGEVLELGDARVPTTCGGSRRGLAPVAEDGPEGALAAIRTLAADVAAGHARVEAEREAKAEREAEREREAAAKREALAAALATDPTSTEAAEVAKTVLRGEASEDRTAWLTAHLREAPIEVRATPRGKAHAQVLDGRLLLAEGWTTGPHCRLPDLDDRVQAERHEREDRERAELLAALEAIDPSLLPRAREGLLPARELQAALARPVEDIASQVDGLGPQIPRRGLSMDDDGVESLSAPQYVVWQRCQAVGRDFGVQAALVGLDVYFTPDVVDDLGLGAYAPRVDDPYLDGGYEIDEDGEVRIRHPGVRLTAEIGGRQVSVAYLLPVD